VRLRFILSIVILTAVATPASAQTADADDIVARATAYVEQFIVRFSNVVAEERYLQESQKPPRTTGSGFSQTFVPSIPDRVELRSDFLLVRVSEAGDWSAFRDVFSVNGRPVRDREDRLIRLFTLTPAAAPELARKTARESARYNLGGQDRTFNHPLLALGLLQRRYRDRFEISLRRADPQFGAGVVVVGYKEHDRPTILRRNDDRDLPIEGRWWIDSASGRVVRTEMVVLGSDRITTSFASDEQFQIDVPVEMSEAYVYRGAAVTGAATYGRFRRFAVQTEQDLRLK
jgi:hypothetical protein